MKPTGSRPPKSSSSAPTQRLKTVAVLSDSVSTNSDLAPTSFRNTSSVNYMRKTPFRVLDNSTSSAESSSVEPSSAKLQQYYEGEQQKRQQQYTRYLNQRSCTARDASVVMEDSLSLVSNSTRGNPGSDKSASSIATPDANTSNSAVAKMKRWMSDSITKNFSKDSKWEMSSRAVLIVIVIVAVGVALYLYYRRKKTSDQGTKSNNKTRTPRLQPVDSLQQQQQQQPETFVDPVVSVLGQGRATAEDIRQAALSVPSGQTPQISLQPQPRFEETLRTENGSSRSVRSNEKKVKNQTSLHLPSDDDHRNERTDTESFSSDSDYFDTTDDEPNNSRRATRGQRRSTSKSVEDAPEVQAAKRAFRKSRVANGRGRAQGLTV